MKTPELVKSRCLDINCPIWGWVKVPFNILNFNYWEDCRDRGIEISFICVCGQDHELILSEIYN